eukprot:gb/GECG01016779.1/.p1 GENE.gb/GECG01016779.1/~~gb/GECG01016779.1/.p1  ORF type:complete len:182 (+),score=29.64 gb/GECG01016779.1/:1-546(+)
MASSSSGRRPVLVKGPEGEELDIAHWIMVYPCYLDGSKTVKQGRKVPKEICGDCHGPTVMDIRECCIKWGLRHAPEIKHRHPRDWRSYGRVRVELKDEQGNVVNEQFPTRRKLFEELARTIPTLESRKKRLEQMKQQMQGKAGSSAATGAEGQQESSAETPATSGRRNKKKDRKERRKKKG